MAKKNAIDRLTPNSKILVVDGEELRLAADKAENTILNMLLAAQGRALITRTLKRYKDLEETPSPKELRDIAAALRDIAAFSSEVYEAAEPISAGMEKEKEAEKADVTDISFEDLTKKDDVRNSGSSNDAGSSFCS